jgi:hypothetical protein
MLAILSQTHSVDGAREFGQLKQAIREIQQQCSTHAHTSTVEYSSTHLPVKLYKPMPVEQTVPARNRQLTSALIISDPSFLPVF